jgi:hypothetical protein
MGKAQSQCWLAGTQTPSGFHTTKCTCIETQVNSGIVMMSNMMKKDSLSLSLSLSQGSAAVTCLSMASFLNAMLIISQVIGGGGRGRGYIPREVLQSICPFEHHLSAMEIEVWFVVHEMRRKKLTERNKVLPSTYGDVSLIRPSSSAASKSPPSSCRQWQPCVEESHYSV